MNREIKFRVWDKVYKKFQQDSNFLSTALGDRSSGLCVNKDDLILQQFTGLKDKNGREIYEGDIVSAIDSGYSRGKRFNFEVVYLTDNNYSGFIFKNKDGIFTRVFTPEIVGNIFENPELLKP